MRIQSPRFVVALVSILALNAGFLLFVRHELLERDRAEVRVLEALPGADLEGASRLSLVFDRDLAPAEAIGQPLEHAPFTIEPRAPGAFSWGAPDRLDYVLARPLQPGRTYVLRPAEGSPRIGGRWLAGRDAFRFETRALALEIVEVQEAGREHVTLRLRFNQPVDPLAVKEKLRLTCDRHATGHEAELLGERPGDTVTIQTRRPRSDRLRVQVLEGLLPHGGDRGLAVAVDRVLDVTPVLTLLRATPDTPSLDDEVTVTLRFNRALKRNQTMPAVRTEPRVPGLRVRRTGSSQLTLEGPFTPGRRYAVTVPPTVMAHDGQTLAEAQRAVFTVPERAPRVELTARRGVLSPYGNRTLDLRCVNADAVTVRAARVYPNNLVSHLRGASRWQTSLTAPVKTFPLDLPRDTPETVSLDLGAFLGEDARGVYRIEAKTAARSWFQTRTTVTITDLGLTLKRERGAAFVLATSLRTAAPVQGARVRALTVTNQELSAALTGADGTARLTLPTDHPDGEPWVLVCEKGRELSYLLFDGQTQTPKGIDLGGRAHPETYDVLLYPERSVYRPGDPVHLTGIVRERDGSVPPPFPLEVRVARPDGVRVATLRAEPAPGGQGVFHARFDTRADGQTGGYRFAVTLPGAAAVLTEATAFVEAFVPARIEVAAAFPKPRYGPLETPTLTVSARYLFGAPAKGLPVTARGKLVPVRFRSQRHPDFSFRSPEERETVRLSTIEEALDDAGRAALALRGEDDAPRGLYEARLAVTVSEPGGRSLSRSASAQVDTVFRHLGLKVGSGAATVPVREEVPVRWVHLDGADVPADARPVSVAIARVDLDTVLERASGGLTWRTEERLTEVDTAEIAAPDHDGHQGRTAFSFPEPGRYRVRVTDPAGRASVLEVRAAARGDAWAGAAERPDRVELTIESGPVAPGGTAQVQVQSPFPGTLLLTLETDRVVWRTVRALAATAARVEVPVPASVRGGAFLTATVLRPLDPDHDTWRPHRAFGMARVQTDHRAKQLPVAIAAPPRAAPGEVIAVTVSTGAPGDGEAPGLVHLFGVDQGILLMGGGAAPDPFAHFYGPRRALVTTGDTYAALLPDQRRAAGTDQIGGDGGFAERLRRTPVPARHRQAAVVFHRAIPAGADGTATVEIRLPRISGELRLFAVAVRGDRFGAAEQPVRVAAKVHLEAAWPRAVAPGDRFRVPVKVANASGATLVFSVRAEIDGPLRIEGGAPRVTFDLAADQSDTFWLDVVAERPGPVTARLVAEASPGPDGAAAERLGEDHVELAVRPAAVPDSRSQLLSLAAGQTLRLDPFEGFLPGTAEATLSVSARPTVQLLPALEQLIDYPHGCVEQTTSRALALLVLPELMTDYESGSGRAEAVRSMIRAGIDRLASMQVRSGGLSYWPGSDRAHLFGTAYAAGFLAQAKDGGFDLPEGLSPRLVRYLKEALAGGSGDEVDMNLRAQIVAALGALGHLETGWLAHLEEQAPLLDRAGRAHLARGLLSAGRRDRALAVLSEEAGIASAVAAPGGSRLCSATRADALLLSVLLELDPGDARVPALVRLLEQARTDGAWRSTLENASALAALARYQRGLTGEGPSFAGTVGLADGREAAFDHASPLRLRLGSGAAPASITTRGQGTVYLTVTAEGLTEGHAGRAYDRGLRVRRRLTGADGRAIDLDAIRSGDLVHVEVTLLAPGLEGGERLQNVAIVDALPGGLEVERPQLSGSDVPDRVEFRDDRVVLFTHATSEVRSFRYALRAVNAGRFALPPIQASSMYDPGYASLHGAGTIEVTAEAR